MQCENRKRGRRRGSAVDRRRRRAGETEEVEEAEALKVSRNLSSLSSFLYMTFKFNVSAPLIQISLAA